MVRRVTVALFKLKPTTAFRLLLCGVLAGCASTPSAPVVDRSIGSPPRARAQTEAGTSVARGSYRVQRGDTLYSIAFRNGLDYRDLAQRNGIRAPYTIYVGQVIALAGRAGTPARAAATAKASPPPSRSAPAPAPLENVQGSPITSAPAPSLRPAPSTAPPNAPAVVAAPASSPTAPATAGGGGNLAWRWPAEGARVSGFVAGDQTRQGVDIAGKAGDPVRAAADGQVVYSGNGLIGYGELIIVKHNASLLSAYGHNRRRLVQEGDSVKAGQQIAEMGSTSASRDMLHFEIRRNGKPVDPMAFLPPR